MNNLINYLKWRGDLGFDISPLNEVDALIFSELVYLDFSGYTDIARGAARMMGIRLMENFRHPYRAVSIQDFWKRWHISLTCWFTDYVYIPLGGNRRGFAKRCRNVLIVFLLSGFWSVMEFCCMGTDPWDLYGWCYMPFTD